MGSFRLDGFTSYADPLPSGDVRLRVVVRTARGRKRDNSAVQPVGLKLSLSAQMGELEFVRKWRTEQRLLP